MYSILNSFLLDSCTAREFLYPSVKLAVLGPFRPGWNNLEHSNRTNWTVHELTVDATRTGCARGRPTACPRWRVASAQKLSWAALRGSAHCLPRQLGCRATFHDMSDLLSAFLSAERVPVAGDELVFASAVHALHERQQWQRRCDAQVYAR